MKSLKSIVLNWIGGGKTPIPVRFLKSVDIPGDNPNNINTLEILQYDNDNDLTLETALSYLKLNGKTPTAEELSKLNSINCIVIFKDDTEELFNTETTFDINNVVLNKTKDSELKNINITGGNTRDSNGDYFWFNIFIDTNNDGTSQIHLLVN